jgi:hypothetical protein
MELVKVEASAVLKLTSEDVEELTYDLDQLIGYYIEKTEYAGRLERVRSIRNFLRGIGWNVTS